MLFTYKVGEWDGKKWKKNGKKVWKVKASVLKVFLNKGFLTFLLLWIAFPQTMKERLSMWGWIV